LGDLMMSRQKLISLNLSPMNIYEGREMDGILGYDFLSRFVFEIDYENSRMTFYEPKSFNYTGKGDSLDIDLYQNSPHIKATVDGKYEGMFTLDTGSRKSLDLNAPFVKENGFFKRYPDAIEALGGAGIGGETKSLQTRIKAIQIGNFEIKEPITGLSIADEGAFKAEKTQGNIGGGILKRFKATFDYENRKVFLEKDDYFDQKDEFDKSGLMIIWQDGRFLIQRIYAGSPAEKAKIQEGEELIFVNGDPVTKYSLSQLRDVLSGKDGTKIKLQLKKDDKAREVTFKLKSLI